MQIKEENRGRIKEAEAEEEEEVEDNIEIFYYKIYIMTVYKNCGTFFKFKIKKI